MGIAIERIWNGPGAFYLELQRIGVARTVRPRKGCSKWIPPESRPSELTRQTRFVPLLLVCRQARSYRLYYPVVSQGYRLRTLGPKAQFVGGVLRIEGILLHPTRCGPASHGTAQRTCPIIKKSETVDGFCGLPRAPGPGWEQLAISGLNRRSLPGPSRA